MSTTHPAIGEAARLDEKAVIKDHYEHQAAAAEYPRLLRALTDLYEGLGCDPVEGNARVIVMLALGITEMPKVDPCELVLEELPNGEFAWMRKAA